MSSKIISLLSRNKSIFLGLCPAPGMLQSEFKSSTFLLFNQSNLTLSTNINNYCVNLQCTRISITLKNQLFNFKKMLKSLNYSRLCRLFDFSTFHENEISCNASCVVNVQRLRHPLTNRFATILV